METRGRSITQIHQRINKAVGLLQDLMSLNSRQFAILLKLERWSAELVVLRANAVLYVDNTPTEAGQRYQKEVGPTHHRLSLHI